MFKSSKTPSPFLEDTAAPESELQKAEAEFQSEIIPGPGDKNPHAPVSLTNIASTTVLRGTLEAKDNVRLDGALYGDVRCEARLTVTGAVNGSIVAGSVIIDGATVVGDITCAASAAILDGAQIVGDIAAGEISVSGRVKGSITVQNSIYLESDALIIGDIAGAVIEIKPGAYVSGSVTVGSKNIAEEKFFDRVAQIKAIGPSVPQS